MRVGIDATAVLDELTGVEVHVLTTVDALAGTNGDAAEEVVLFVRQEPPAAWKHLPDRFRIVRFPTRSQAVATQVLLPGAARRQRLDVLYCPAKPPPAAAPVPVLTMIHDDVPWTHGSTMGRGAARWYRTFYRIALRRGAVVATPSRAAGDAVTRTIPAASGRVHVVGNALAPWLRAAAAPGAPTPARPAIAGDGPYTLSLCRIEPRKDLATVLHAWELVRPEAGDHRLLLAGKAGWRVSEVVERARRTPGVELLGEVPDDALPGLYAHAGAFVTASRNEGFGLPVLEAMAFGVPIVASAIPAHLEVGGPAIEPFEPGDARALAAAWRAVLTDRRRAAAAREAGPRTAAAWSPDQLATRLRAALAVAAGA